MLRKITILALTLCLAVSAQAQFYLGGNLGLSTSSGDDRVGIIIAPEFGYHFNPYLSVGGTVSYRSLSNSFGISPYVRGYLFNIADVVRIFLTAQAPLNFSGNYQSYGAFLRPGVSVRITGNTFLMAHIGAFGYSYVKYGDVGQGGWIAKVNQNTINIGFGFCFGS
ncbi:MAG: porin family protein [Bacteroidales bacterium]|nr:porin family protein [Bacteroidales bacterium]